MTSVASSSRTAYLIALIVGFFGCCGAAVAEPVALILEADPADLANPYSEVQGPAEIALDGGRLTFIHYGRCVEATVQGDVLKLSLSDFEITGGRIVQEVTRDCPEEIAVASIGETAGIVLRGAEEPADAVAGVRPRLVAVGDAVAAVRLRRGDHMFDLRRSGSVFSLAAGTPPLAVGRYDARLFDDAGDVIKTVTIDVRADAQSDKLLILR